MGPILWVDQRNHWHLFFCTTKVKAHLTLKKCDGVCFVVIRGPGRCSNRLRLEWFNEILGEEELWQEHNRGWWSWERWPRRLS